LHPARRLVSTLAIPLALALGPACSEVDAAPDDATGLPDAADVPDTADAADTSPDGLEGCDELPGAFSFAVRLLDDWPGLDPTGVSGAVDGAGRAHFVYSRDGALSLGVWGGAGDASIEVVPLGVPGFAFGVPRLALDAADQPHLLYGRGDGDVIEYRAAHPDGAEGFDHVVLDPDVGGSMVIPPDLAVAGDALIAAWRIEGESPLAWATRAAAGGWTVESFGDATASPAGTAVARTPDGTDHVVFFDATAGRFTHAHRAAGANAWTSDTLATPTSTGFARRAAVGVGPDGALYAVHFDQGLRLGVLRGGAWSALTHTGDGELLNPRVAVDACGVVFVAYVDVGALEVRLLYGRSDVGWSTLTVATLATEVNTPLTLGLTPDERVFLLWYEPDRAGDGGEGHNRIWGALGAPMGAPPPAVIP